ncbi:MAG TPA: hypothetical protein VNO86_05085 [Candidatus Binatia bacterium]|nr:hypothetical protein [Candidatus Binatia bacterium]
MTGEALRYVARRLLLEDPSLVEDARANPGNSTIGAVLGLVSGAPRWLTEQAVVEALEAFVGRPEEVDDDAN